jgi:hypothetical protein
MATTLTVAGNTIGGLDSFTAVVDATTQLSKDPSNKGLIANCDAALANAAVTVAAGMNGEIAAAFAANAIIANIAARAVNHSTMSAADRYSSVAAITGVRAGLRWPPEINVALKCNTL